MLITAIVQVPTRMMNLSTRGQVPLWAVTACSLAIVCVALAAIRSRTGEIGTEPPQ